MGWKSNIHQLPNIRNAVRYVRSSTARAKSFREAVERVKIDYNKKPSLDVETRWNSTFLMLETAEKYAEAFKRLNLIDFKYRSYFHGNEEDDAELCTRKKRRKEKVFGALEQEDWEIARQFIEYLRLFYNVTNAISGTKKKSHGPVDEKKFDKYLSNIDNINFLLYVAVVLDPRNKMCYLDYCLGQVYGMDAPKAKEIREKIIKTLNELFDYYKQKVDKVNARNAKSSSSTSTFLNSKEKVSLESSFMKYLEENGHGITKSEVDTYLADGMEKRDDRFDIFSWWKMNSLKFSILSQVARHVLGIPISTVASESAFSTGGRVIDPFRSSLTPKTTEALVCMQDWIRATSIDIESQIMPTNAELQEKMEKLELEEFTPGEKLFEPIMEED